MFYETQARNRCFNELGWPLGIVSKRSGLSKDLLLFVIFGGEIEIKKINFFKNNILKLKIELFIYLYSCNLIYQLNAHPKK